MEAKAIRRFVRTSPRKMRLVIDLIRGKSASQALATLKFCPKHAATDAVLVLKSAIANLENKSFDVDSDKIMVKEAFVNQGPSMKRISPAPMGRAYRIIKRSHHLTIVVSAE
ncbi:MAG: 50S ribosomal protein L22 [Bacteroidetes bacterium]|nr:50S ribosomal protein L22 [Bacteroidota bacterium]